MREFAPVALVTYFALAGAVVVAALVQQRDVRSQNQSSALTSAEATERINALIPDSDRVAVTAQPRDVDQRELTIDFTLRDAALSVAEWKWIGFAIALLVVAMFARHRPTVRASTSAVGPPVH